MPLQFDWDPTKAEDNLEKHGVGFPEAASVFGDPLSLTIADPSHSEGEERFVTLGLTAWGKLVVVCHVDRGSEIRIISARPATSRERREYERGS